MPPIHVILSRISDFNPTSLLPNQGYSKLSTRGDTKKIILILEWNINVCKTSMCKDAEIAGKGGGFLRENSDYPKT